jgi:hypothetical protein
MELTLEQKQNLYENGYIKLPGIVSKELVDTALWKINRSLGSQGIPPDEIPSFQSTSFCPELVTDPAILDLLNQSPLWSLAESLIGVDQVAIIPKAQIALRFPNTPVPKAQIALRFPNTQSLMAAYQPHLDGMYSPLNGVPKNTILSFTGLIGIFLSHIPEDYMGNFTIWPGTHRLYESYFKEHGTEVLLEGMPPVELPSAQQIVAEPGDAVLCHYQLGHTVVANASPHIRYAVFFRFLHKNHESVRMECLTDIWREWEGMREIV